MALYMGLKHSSLFTEWILVYYKPICGYSGCVLCNCRWQTDVVVLTPQLDDSKVAIWTAYFDIAMVINDLSDIKQKVFIPSNTA